MCGVRFCGLYALLPSTVQEFCRAALDTYGTIIQEMVLSILVAMYGVAVSGECTRSAVVAGF